MMLPSPVRLTSTTVMGGDSRVDEVAAQAAKTRKGSVLVGAR